MLGVKPARRNEVRRRTRLAQRRGYAFCEICARCRQSEQTQIGGSHGKQLIRAPAIGKHPIRRLVESVDRIGQVGAHVAKARRPKAVQFLPDATE